MHYKYHDIRKHLSLDCWRNYRHCKQLR